VLRRFYSDAQFAKSTQSVTVSVDNSTEAPAGSQSLAAEQTSVPEGYGTVNVTSAPGAEISLMTNSLATHRPR